MKTSSKIWIFLTVLLIAALAGVIVWLSIWVSQERARGDAARLQVENVYENALYDSLDSVAEVENSLAKLLVSNSKSESVSLAADVYKDANAAAEIVGRLPVDMYKHTGLQKFLNQVGDFAVCYIRAVGGGADVTAYDDQVEQIYAVTENVKQQLIDAVARIGTDGYTVIANIDAEGMLTIGDGQINIEYPSIIYDGPFSDSTEKREWKAISGMDEIGEEDALKIAKEKLGLDGKIIGISGGDAALYLIEGTAGGKEAFASVTKNGGMLASAVIMGEDGGARLKEKDATANALAFAEKLGYSKSLTPVWYNETANMAAVNLAPEIGGVIYYPDLVKIKISLTDGSLLGVEACNYCINHVTRSLPTVTMDEESAKTCVSSRLKVSSSRLAVIPKGTSERFCYEIAGHYKGLDYFVYVDAVTGDQVDIMRVIDDNQGKMVV